MNDIAICAYVAAFLDTDGWITIVPRNNGRTHGVMVGLVNRHKEVLEWVQEQFGGYLKTRKFSRKSPHAKNWSQTYDLIFRSDEMVILLNSVKHFLRIKKEQADLALELLETRRDISKEYRLSPEVRQRRYEIYKRARELNWAGIDRSGLAEL